MSVDLTNDKSVLASVTTTKIKQNSMHIFWDTLWVTGGFVDIYAITTKPSLFHFLLLAP